MGDLVILPGKGSEEASVHAESGPRRQCWECVRRRLVCDYGKPSCKKCEKAGVDCPGYSEKKPLKWVAPGKVTSRTRRRKSPPRKKENPTKEQTHDIKLLEIAGKTCVESISAAMLRVDETSAIVHAIHYYNTQVFNDMMPVSKMAPNSPYLVFIPLEMVHYYSDCMRNIMVCIAIGHAIHRLPRPSNNCALTYAWSRLYHYRGLAIQELSQAIGNETKRTKLQTFGGIFMLMVAELRHLSSDWRHHFEGTMQLIQIRGGLRRFLDDAPTMKWCVLYFIIVAVLGNTTSPSSDQIPTSIRGFVELIAELYPEGFYPTVLCPPPLFLHIIAISHLRDEASTALFIDKSMQSAAEELLRQINTFSPEEYAATQDFGQEEWLLLSRIYQSAVALYCISSLQSLFVLPFTPQLRIARTAHKTSLFTLLKKAMASPVTKICMLWPLIVAGVEARDASLDVKLCIGHGLEEMSWQQGTTMPLYGLQVLKNFWDSGKTEWDECFHKPFAFVI
ncbi:uncharacterized protein BDR25DRAFT_262571 [Lindgomyces ingoldianus]|uniref:Uncharacterized protein n=1 Tax=Lindgomyces ingoldianus TaxID=673940 RepID=A0ACB6QSN7_9PLEO|nr:uncharacterized protein BDR25DRAFT_262571 [Lindgomyces ingoldianus]KAF2470019.1 hypothetical protein BDR25DRAFT_262571 [Lindgomyces ingoldianus]